MEKIRRNIDTNPFLSGTQPGTPRHNHWFQPGHSRSGICHPVLVWIGLRDRAGQPALCDWKTAQELFRAAFLKTEM